MAEWSDVFRALASWWPLSQKNGAYPLIMQPQTNPIVLAGGGTGTATIELPGDCNLQIDDWVGWCSDSGYAANGVFPVRFSIYYGSGDWAFNYPASNPVRGELIFGWGRQIGRIGYRPWFVSTYGNRGVLSFNMTNLNTTTLTLEFALRGHRQSTKNGG